MSSKYKAYPEYRDSGVEWVGNIPNSWDVKPLFATCSHHSEKNLDGREENVLSLSYGRIIRRDIEKNHGLLPESFNTYQIVFKGDIILRLTDLQNDWNSLRVGRAIEKGVITSAYLKLAVRPQSLDSRYLYRLLHSYDTTKVFYGMGGGLRQSMKFDDMRRLDTLLPPLPEQIQIAKFLDYETAKIDELIEKQQELIALLKEKRQAVISHAVTKGLPPEAAQKAGLNPHPPLKDSGIEWLGQVPKHWKLKQLRYLTRQIGGGTPSKENPSFWNGDIPWVSPKDMKVDYLAQSIDNITEKAVTESAAKLIPKNSLLIVVRGMILVHSVPVSLTMKEVTINQDMKALVPHAELQSEYFLYLLKGFREFILNLVEESAHGTKCLRTDLLDRVVLPIPPSDEQELIVQRLKETLTKFDELEDSAETQITLLQERRTALISAAVTGKIDVRDWQAPSQESS